jgi:hypothetical protein
VVSLVAPWLMLRDVWMACAPATVAPAEAPGRPPRRRVDERSSGAGLVHAWWVLWLGGGLLGTFATIQTPPARLPDYIAYAERLMFAAASLIPATLLAMLLVLRIERRQRNRAAAVVDEAAAPAAPAIEA